MKRVKANVIYRLTNQDVGDLEFDEIIYIDRDEEREINLGSQTEEFKTKMDTFLKGEENHRLCSHHADLTEDMDSRLQAIKKALEYGVELKIEVMLVSDEY
jgi:hypothetical protein